MATTLVKTAVFSVFHPTDTKCCNAMKPIASTKAPAPASSKTPAPAPIKAPASTKPAPAKEDNDDDDLFGDDDEEVRSRSVHFIHKQLLTTRLV